MSSTPDENASGLSPERAEHVAVDSRNDLLHGAPETVARLNMLATRTLRSARPLLARSSHALRTLFNRCSLAVRRAGSRERGGERSHAHSQSTAVATRALEKSQDAAFIEREIDDPCHEGRKLQVDKKGLLELRPSGTCPGCGRDIVSTPDASNHRNGKKEKTREKRTETAHTWLQWRITRSSAAG